MQFARRRAMTIHDLMKRPAITCHVNDSLERAARLMWEYDVGAIIVVREDGKATGVITDRDICMAAFTQGRLLADLLVHSAMSNHLVVARLDQTLDEIEKEMTLHQLRRIPVVDADHHPVGMLTLSDIALEAASPDSQLVQGRARVANVLAAVARPRFPGRVAA